MYENTTLKSNILWNSSTLIKKIELTDLMELEKAFEVDSQGHHDTKTKISLFDKMLPSLSSS